MVPHLPQACSLTSELRADARQTKQWDRWHAAVGGGVGARSHRAATSARFCMPGGGWNDAWAQSIRSSVAE
eukprot:2679133-Prymnesium_polylepis.1